MEGKLATLDTCKPLKQIFLGCPLISLRSETKRNGSENERCEIAEQKVGFACFALKRNRIFYMRNEMQRSEKYRKLV